MSEKLKIQDLRVGNVLKWKDNGSIFELTLDLFCDRNFQNHIENGDIIGIPLTSEILLACGFEETENGYFRFPQLSEVDILIDKDFDSISIDGICFCLCEHLSLHQIQNVVYHLFNEELEFKTELK